MYYHRKENKGESDTLNTALWIELYYLLRHALIDSKVDNKPDYQMAVWSCKSVKTFRL